MALETLKGVKVIGGFEVEELVSEPGSIMEVPPEDKYITIDYEENVITFKIQNGPIKEHGVNGCQVDTFITTAAIIIRGLNKDFPCRENSCAITKLDEALMWLKERTRDRETRGVEGTNQE